MRINSVEAVPLYRELDERFANAQKWITSREHCLVRIETDNGITGWGECWGPVAGNREIVTDYVGPWLEGRDPRNVETIHHDLQFELESAFHSFVPASVVSGVDIALWDAYGKAVGEPISRLLGGHRRDEVRAYATGHFFSDVDDFDDLRASVVKEAQDHVDAGFDALKNKIGLARHFPWNRAEDVELVRAIREEVGDDVRLMTDANHAYDAADAQWVADRLAEFDVHFFEEPVPPRAIDTYRRVNRGSAVSLAGGECWAFEHEFEHVLNAGAVDFVQPDVTSAGGLTTTRRVATLAESYGVQCLPHVFGSAIALAASLQMLATVPGDPMLEFDRTPNPVRDDLAVDPITNDGNTVSIPDSPGLGIDIDEDILATVRSD